MFPRPEERGDWPDPDSILHSRHLVNRQPEPSSITLLPLDEKRRLSLDRPCVEHGSSSPPPRVPGFELPSIVSSIRLAGIPKAADLSPPIRHAQPFRQQEQNGPGELPYREAENLPHHIPRVGLNTLLNQTEEASTLFAGYAKPRVDNEPAAVASLKIHTEDARELGHASSFTTFIKESGNALERGKPNADAERYKWQTNPLVEARSDPRSAIDQPSIEPSKFDPSKYTDPFCKFLTENPTVFHFVDAVAKELASKGFRKLSERDTWKLERGGKYYVERNGSALIGFVVGENYEPGNGVAMSACHVDSITTKRESLVALLKPYDANIALVKPIAKLRTKAGFERLGEWIVASL
jgi:hypothetical protein